MKKLIILSLIICALAFPCASRASDDLHISVSLVKGESSKDSHSTLTKITIQGSEIVYEKSFRGGRRREPVNKRYKISDEELRALRQLITEKGLLASDTLELPQERSGVRRYFTIELSLQVGGKSSAIKISGPRSASEIRQKPIYQKADALLEAIFKLITAQDKDAAYESRTLIEERR